MLQEATRAINSAFNNSFIKKLSQYLHDCVREEVKSSTFRNLKADRDNKWIFLDQEDRLFTEGLEHLRLEGSDSKLTELMIQSETSQKDKYLIYGYLFLVGKAKAGKKNEFLTPLLYSPCRLERNGVNINCMLTDEFLSLNTGALTALMKKSDDEDETDEYKIVGSQEADPFMSKISNESPIAKAIMNKKVGDIVEVESPNGVYKIEITDIK